MQSQKNMKTQKMEQLNFSVVQCRELFDNASRNDTKFKEATDYFHDRCFFTESGLICYYKDGKLIYVSKKNFEDNFMDGMDSKLKKAIKLSSPDPYEMVLEEGDFLIEKSINGKRGKINGLLPMYVHMIDKKVTVGKKGIEYVEHFK
jgi:hypothetical protein